MFVADGEPDIQDLWNYIEDRLFDPQNIDLSWPALLLTNRLNLPKDRV